MRRIECRWGTRFGSWVSGLGVERVALETGVTVQSVYMWVSGSRTPDPRRALTMTRISGGQLSLADIYAQATSKCGDDSGRADSG